MRAFPLEVTSIEWQSYLGYCDVLACFFNVLPTVWMRDVLSAVGL